jgi:hypothetical protein
MELSYTYWKDDGWFVGHLDDYPDYITQGETIEKLGNLRTTCSVEVPWRFSRYFGGRLGVKNQLC